VGVSTPAGGRMSGTKKDHPKVAKG
jgi:hypothetical protein